MPGNPLSRAQHGNPCLYMRLLRFTRNGGLLRLFEARNDKVDLMDQPSKDKPSLYIQFFSLCVFLSSLRGSFILPVLYPARSKVTYV